MTNGERWPSRILTLCRSADDWSRLAPFLSALDPEAPVVVLAWIASGENPTEETHAVQQLRRELQRAVDATPSLRCEVRVRVSEEIASTVAATRAEELCDLLVVDVGQLGDGSGHILPTFQELLLHPPCDMLAVRLAEHPVFEPVLLSARGGPQAQFGTRIASLLQQTAGSGVITLLHIDQPSSDWSSRQHELDLFLQVNREAVRKHNLRVSVQHRSSDTPVDVLAREAGAYGIVIIGSRASRELEDGHVLGVMAERLMASSPATIAVLRTGEPIDPQIFTPAPAVDRTVDTWFAENTFHVREFSEMERLVELKQERGVSISLAIPALNEEPTVARILEVIQDELVQRHPILDEIVLIDGGSTDRTVELARAAGVTVLEQAAVLPEYGDARGKGDAMWRSLYCTRGDLVIWMDADIKNAHSKFVYGVVGPLLRYPQLQYVAGFYRRTVRLGAHEIQLGGDKINELTARPLINLFYPELSGMIEPASRETGGFREVLEQLPFSSGFGVELGNLIDVYNRLGLSAIGQVDLEERLHRDTNAESLAERALAITQVVMNRLAGGSELLADAKTDTALKTVRWKDGRYYLQVRAIDAGQRPPMIEVSAYRERRAAALGTTANQSQ